MKWPTMDEFAQMVADKAIDEIEYNGKLTRAGITTFAELEQMTDKEIANIRGLGLRGYKEILEKLGRNDNNEC